MRLRLTPEVRILHDVAVERGERVLEILDRLKEEDPDAFAPENARGGATSASSSGADSSEQEGNAVLSEEYEEEDDEDDEEGFFDESDLSEGQESGAENSDADEPDFLVLEDDAVSGTGEKYNPFLEGVGDPRYDSDVEQEEPRTFFSSDMFPDADPLLDEIKLKQREDQYVSSQKSQKRKDRRKR